MKKTIRLRGDETARAGDETKTQAADEQKQQLAKLPFLALAFFLILGGMGLYTIHDGQAKQEDYRLLDARGQTASGQVTSKSWTGGKGARYLLYYTFTDASGARRQGGSPVSSAVYDATQTGASVNVTYLPDRQDVATIGQSIGKSKAQADTTVGYMLIGIGCVVGLLLALLPFFLRKRVS